MVQVGFIIILYDVITHNQSNVLLFKSLSFLPSQPKHYNFNNDIACKVPQFSSILSFSLELASLKDGST